VKDYEMMSSVVLVLSACFFLFAKVGTPTHLRSLVGVAAGGACGWRTQQARLPHTTRQQRNGH
jgi:hypothetical protein